ncbi:MAG TPA: TIGR00375 family protein [Thermoplasmata archaeon]|nr:TIGR00375 family protein [Thermoplasmata archaeon]
MLINADLHIHSRFSAATSRSMTKESLAEGAARKGVHLIGSGDCLHPQWLDEVTSHEEVAEGTYEVRGLRVILTAEVEALHRIHHLILFPSRSAVEAFREAIGSRAAHLETDGRPNIQMGGEEIGEAALDVGALFGPAHAFTPWTAMYAYHATLEECYGSLAGSVSFIELGLSANSDYADRIADLQDVTFLTNSDAHSASPLRLAREFNRFEVEEATFREIARAIERTGGRRSVLNVGLPPEEGKYNESACIKCFRHYDLASALERGWSCPCGGRIKKGVRDRVEELATWSEPRHPDHRPPYLSLVPLAEIVALATGMRSPTTVSVRMAWERLVDAFGDEVNVLVDRPLDEVADVAEPRVVSAIRAFREGRVVIRPGGGGRYGQAELPRDSPSLLDF